MNIQFVVVVLTVLSNCHVLAATSRCDHPFQETPGGKCIFSPKQILQGTWDEAQEICGFLNKDSRLLEFRTADELLDVTSFLSQNDADCARWPSGGGPWIGAIEVGNTNQFIWSSDNSTVVVENWVQGQPNSPSSGDGAMMSCEFSFEWMDKSRDTVLPVLCEVEPRAKCPAQFTAVGDTCYHLGFSSTTWDLAQDYCHSLAPNGKLIELETLEEIYLVTEFLNDNSDPSRYYWTGAEERQRHDYFYWGSSGKPVVITNWWSDYAPDSDTSDAVALLDGDNHGWRWKNDYSKSSSFYELCEADPADL